MIYPVIMKTVEGLAVGFMSGGQFKVPVGAVQMRVDGNEAIMVTPENTPNISEIEAWFAPFIVDIPGLDNDAINNAQKVAVENAMRMSQPYTLVVGDEADRILDQMLSGQNLIYRQILVNQPNPSTGRVPLDQSLSEALRKAGLIN
ncbi:hypothetical protein S7S_01535 [Isoalcanivorax pacificus W11-5]|uniref:Uncharacterized protein n=2 Tax=Isoalcanivorax TaxID=3020833 RepID=A0A0B4XI30_9GAMM|nr:hypothetical protein S7S_01535 [Isoalcanivorax pacificus W11-5]